jgi:DNA repair photolyase
MSSEVFGTLEWATHNVNIINGCLHDCKYCYSKEMAIRFKRKTSETWRNEELTNIDTLKIPKNSGTVMFPSSHDLSPDFIDEEIKVIRLLLEANKKLLLVTKPHTQVIKNICDQFKDYRDSIIFRFTIGSASEDTLRFWEPNAPGFDERLESLKYSYNNGFKTSISCEPMLDNKTNDLIYKTLEYITDCIWIGKPNFLLRRLKMNGYEDSSIEFKKAKVLLELLSDDYIFELYNQFRTNKRIKWKESIKKIVGIRVPEIVGLDI